MNKASRSLPFDISSYGGYLICILLLSLIVHLTTDKVSLFFGEAVNAYAPTVKGIVFLLTVIALLIPIAKDAWRVWRRSSWRDILVPLAVALGVLVVSMFLIFQRGPIGLGVDYSLRSESPFVQVSDWQNTRLLMPALSYFLFLRGTWPFYGFFLALVLTFLAMLYSWNLRHANLSLWEFLSLCTASFVAFQFQAPGYPDILVYAFFLLVMLDDFSPVSKLSALLLALITYESSFIIGLVLAWRYLSRKEQIIYWLAIGIYGLVWVAVWNFDIVAILSSHNVDGMSGLQWVRQNPGLETLGVFMGYKALWAVMVWAAVSAFLSGRRGEAGFILATIGAAVLMTLSAVDTSRLMGYAFPALLVSVAGLKNSVSSRTGRRMLALLFAVNLLIPSVYVGLNAGVKILRGLYGRWIHLLSK